MRTRATTAHNGGHSKKKSKPALCSEPDCGRNAYARGLCQTHHRHLLKSGEVQPIRPYRPRTTGTIKFAGLRVTPGCAAKLRAYAEERNISVGAAITDAVEEWHRRNTRSARKRKRASRG